MFLRIAYIFVILGAVFVELDGTVYVTYLEGATGTPCLMCDNTYYTVFCTYMADCKNDVYV